MANISLSFALMDQHLGLLPLHAELSIFVIKNKLQGELTRTKDLIAWNGFPKRIGDVIINDELRGLNVNNIKKQN